jgi:hypothetical protein
MNVPTYVPELYTYLIKNLGYPDGPDLQLSPAQALILLDPTLTNYQTLLTPI